MAPRKIIMSRPPSPPRRVLTPSRKEKIQEFKRHSQLQPGSYGWILQLISFMDEGGVVTVADVRRWIGRHKWIVSIDSRDDPAERSEINQHRRSATNIHENPQVWQTHAADTSFCSVHELSQNRQTQWPQLLQQSPVPVPPGQQYMIIPANQMQPGSPNNNGNGGPSQFLLSNGPNWSQQQQQPPRSSEPQQNGSTGATGHENNPAPMNIPVPPSMSLNNTRRGSNSSSDMVQSK